MAGELLEVGALFAALAIAGGVAARVGLSVVPAYVVAGVLVGPHVAGRAGLPAVPPGETVTLVAELGIVFLLFFLGLEFSPQRLLDARERLFRAGIVDLANLVVGVAVGLAFGWSLLEAVLLGGVVYVSSSAIITKALLDRGWIADPESEPILGVLVFEDLVVAVYLAVVSSLVVGGESAGETAVAVGVALATLGVIAVASVGGAGWLQRLLNGTGHEAFVLRALGVLVPVAGAALVAGASEAVAAFLVGMGFGTTDHVESLEELLAPLRDAFAAIFFVWVGLNTDPVAVVGVAVPLTVALLVTTPTKALTGYRAGRLFGLSGRRSVRVGTGLVTRGEFSLLIAGIAATGSGVVMTHQIPAFAVGYVLVSSVVGALAMDRADDIAALFGRT